jgi:lipoprotein NlpD
MFKDRNGRGALGLKSFWAAIGVAAVLAGCADVGQDQRAPQPQPEPTASADSANGSNGGGVNGNNGGDAASAQNAPASVTKVVTKTTYYRVRRGDSLAHIAKVNGCSVKELSAWNHLKGGRLRTGQSLKIVSKQTITVQAPAPARAAAVSGDTSSLTPEQKRTVAAELARHAHSVALVWPAQGRVVEGFQPGATRGIEIAGKAGDPVRAAADGKVMYAGTGLNEYGSLIIVQHNKDFLTAYSHNRRLLVKTGDTVRQGQLIAEMGSENNDRVAVLFEVRRDGKPVDPMPYLPPQS